MRITASYTSFPQLHIFKGLVFDTKYLFRFLLGSRGSKTRTHSFELFLWASCLLFTLRVRDLSSARPFSLKERIENAWRALVSIVVYLFSVQPDPEYGSLLLPGCLLPLLVINDTTAAPLPPCYPPLQPCLLHTGTLPFSETDWLWWGRQWGSDRGYSCAQGSVLLDLFVIASRPHAFAGETRGLARSLNLQGWVQRAELVTLWETETHRKCACMINTLKASVLCYVIRG